MAKKKKPGLWANINAKKKRIKRGSGERMRKKGEKGAPSQDALRQAQATSRREDMSEMPTVNTSAIPNPADTAMGPRIRTMTMHDKRRKKDKLPVLLKRFRKYIEDNGIG